MHSSYQQSVSALQLDDINAIRQQYGGIPSIAIPEAIDDTNLSFTHSGNTDWSGQTSTAFSGGDAAQSGSINHSQESCMQTIVSGPGNLNFYWKVSSEIGSDHLRFYINNSEQIDPISGSTDWTQKTYTLGSGNQTLKWCYTKDANTSRGNDRGWVDEIVYSATLDVPLAPTASVQGATQINLSWSMVSGAGYYRLFSNTTEIYAGSNLSYEHTGLTANTSYVYNLQACLDSNANTCSAQSATTTATTIAQYTLNITQPSNGTVTASGINCGSDCSGIYNANTQVQLTATADSDYAFVAWGGACNAGGSTPTFTVTITQNTVCSASFSLVADTIPNSIPAFTSQTGVAINTTISSNTQTITGINTATMISVNNGEYRINAGNWTSTNGTVTNNQTVQVRHTSSSAYSTSATTTLTIGGVSANFTSTTEEPNPPSAPTASVQGTTQINLSWSMVSGAGYYRLFSNTAEIYAGSNLSYEHTELTANTSYVYNLQACLDSNANTCSTQSATTTATTEILQLDTDGDGTPDITDTDDDNDGLTDAFEVGIGTDPLLEDTNSDGTNDGQEDFDGDGSNNLAEQDAGTNPTEDNIAPTLSDSTVIPLNAERRRTAFGIADFGITARDHKDGILTATVLSVEGETYGFTNDKVVLKSGTSELIWQATDAANNSATFTQTVRVLPVANFAFGRKISKGQTATFTVYLSGQAVNYPVTIPFTVSDIDNADYTLSANTFVIRSDSTEGTITANISSGTDAEQMILTMGTLDNAVKGEHDTLTTTILPSGGENIPPRIRSFNVVQDGVSGRVVENRDEDVAISADVFDANGDTLTYSWKSSDLALSGDTNSDSVSFNPSRLSNRSYVISLTLSDDNVSVTRKITIKVIAAVILSSADDTDGDGVNDNAERSDNDNNGIPDYRERPHQPYELTTGTDTYIVAPIGTRLVRGSMADGSGKLTPQRMQAYLNDNGGKTLAVDSHSTTADIFDYKVAELPDVGGTARIVIHTAAIPSRASLRKYILANNEWVGFETDEHNTYASALVEESESCPAEDSEEWGNANTLTAGDNCLRIIIEDGGINDADGAANGSIDDPVAIATTPTPSPSTGGGGSIYWLSVLLLLMLAPFGLRKTRFDRRS
ncbi:OmpA-like transmembrane domain protein [uncultured Candidatus Thioglobus sp.]|nr:OmpA-like transmembrane domain protein [uncultured Candidatus Thioglobus sp.]